MFVDNAWNERGFSAAFSPPPVLPSPDFGMICNIPLFLGSLQPGSFRYLLYMPDIEKFILLFTLLLHIIADWCHV